MVGTFCRFVLPCKCLIMKKAHSPDSNEDSSGKAIRGGSPTADCDCQCVHGTIPVDESAPHVPIGGWIQCVCAQCGPRTTSDNRQCTIQIHPIIGAVFGVILCEECRDSQWCQKKTMSKKTSLNNRKHGECDKEDEIGRPSKKREHGMDSLRK